MVWIVLSQRYKQNKAICVKVSSRTTITHKNDSAFFKRSTTKGLDYSLESEEIDGKRCKMIKERDRCVNRWDDDPTQLMIEKQIYSNHEHSKLLTNSDAAMLKTERFDASSM